VNDEHLAMGDLVREISSQGPPIFAWQVRSAIRRGFLPSPARLGPYRLFRRADLPAIRTALIAAGYLPEEALAGASV
jgi:hypothetical protein